MCGGGGTDFQFILTMHVLMVDSFKLVVLVTAGSRAVTLSLNLTVVVTIARNFSLLSFGEEAEEDEEETMVVSKVGVAHHLQY